MVADYQLMTNCRGSKMTFSHILTLILLSNHCMSPCWAASVHRPGLNSAIFSMIAEEDTQYQKSEFNLQAWSLHCWSIHGKAAKNSVSAWGIGQKKLELCIHTIKCTHYLLGVRLRLYISLRLSHKTCSTQTQVVGWKCKVWEFSAWLTHWLIQGKNENDRLKWHFFKSLKSRLIRNIYIYVFSMLLCLPQYILSH